jgi:hypothetical protein
VPVIMSRFMLVPSIVVMIVGMHMILMGMGMIRLPGFHDGDPSIS